MYVRSVSSIVTSAVDVLVFVDAAGVVGVEFATLFDGVAGAVALPS